MKAVILAAGLGGSLGMGDIPKCLMKVGNQTLIEILVDKLNRAGIKDIILIIGKNGEKVKEVLGDKVTYCVQNKPLGTAHAVMCVKNFINDPFFMVMNGDIYFNDTLIDMIGLRPPTIATYWVEDTSKYGRLFIKSGKLVEIKEKVPEMTSGLINAGIYIFPKGIFDLIKSTPLSPRGSYEITDTIKMLIERGVVFKIHKMRGFWRDIATIDDLRGVEKNITKIV